ncbi:hypothetical protein BaRGS_00001287 [Batillaria attramentaria]|uniref:Uncharacterized protein n=1 Tax=Batillaria attramentaria TaxID=370345 RepID=A0ABD0M762_9CAEN
MWTTKAFSDIRRVQAVFPLKKSQPTSGQYITPSFSVQKYVRLWMLTTKAFSDIRRVQAVFPRTDLIWSTRPLHSLLEKTYGSGFELLRTRQFILASNKTLGTWSRWWGKRRKLASVERACRTSGTSVID